MKCPFCGSHKLQKTFNFNEYNCVLCDSYFKYTTNGLKIFQDGKWNVFCNSICENVKNKIQDAYVINLVHNITKNFAKSSPENIDLLIEEFSKIGEAVLNDYHIGKRNINDAFVIYEEIKNLSRCAITLAKRQEEFNFKIRLNEDIVRIAKENNDTEDKKKIIKLLAKEIIDFYKKTHQDITDQKIAEYIENNHSSHIDVIPKVIKMVRKKIAGQTFESTYIKEENEQNQEKSNNENNETEVQNNQQNDEQVDFQPPQLENSDDDNEDNQQENVDIKKEIESIKSSLDRLSNVLSKETGNQESDQDTTDENQNNTDQQTMQDDGSSSDISSEINQNNENTNQNNQNTNSSGPQQQKPTNESVVKGKKAHNSSYKLKIDNRKANKKDPHQTDMTADEEEYEIPFTQKERTKMLKSGKNTESEFRIKHKILGKDKTYESFNGFKVGDFVFVEDSHGEWKIQKIKGRFFILEKNGHRIKVDTFKTRIQHADHKLEWERENDLIRETKKIWEKYQHQYLLENDPSLQVTGIIGLGGGNRLGGEKYNSSEIIDGVDVTNPSDDNIDYKQPSSKEEIYKYIKDKGLQKINRDIAFSELLQVFVNPEEEINNILDDAILSEDPNQTKVIDDLYGYTPPESSQFELMSNLKNSWNSIYQKELQQTQQKSTQLSNHQPLNVYTSPEDAQLDHALDKSFINTFKDKI